MVDSVTKKSIFLMQKGNLKTLKTVSDLLVYSEKEAADFLFSKLGLKKTSIIILSGSKF